MDASAGHGLGEGHTMDQYSGDRYEHYLAEHVHDKLEEFNQTQEVDAVTPLVDDQGTALKGSSTEQHEEPEHIHFADQTHPEGKSSLRSTLSRPNRTSITSLSLEGYFASHPYRSPPTTRRHLGPTSASNPSSSGSLHALSEYEGSEAIQSSIRRAISTKSTAATKRGRTPSQVKLGSVSQLVTKHANNQDQLVYPDQSFASLQTTATNVRPPPTLRTRSSHPAQNVLYNDIPRSTKAQVSSKVRTADNTPISSPGLFTPSASRNGSLSEKRSGKSQLHHLQAPKETHTAEIEHDVYSGNKFVNNYEIVGELGRGEHGKVKLGRDIERNGNQVAIKIVPRYSTKRRLGKLGAPEDRTKREVAILKRARHSNVVSLLEVIDDPSKNKVYLILEFVEKGEIKWRKHGVKEILAINNQRFDQERLGVNLGVEPSDRDMHIVHLAHARRERLDQMRRYNQGLSHVPNWSLEYAGETDDENDVFDLHRSMSRQFSQVNSPSRCNSQDDCNNLPNEHPLSSSMYSSYVSEPYRGRKFSIAASAVSHMSSEMNFEQDDDQRSYVPALTLEEARRAFQDTLLGLEFLHFIGIIHRDIKPANLLVSSSGAVKISDFGVSYLGRSVTEEEAENKVQDPEATTLDDEKELARSVGTPAFWAPELCYDTTDMFSDKKEPKITGALDLWALGITLYCMIYARLPFYHNETMGIHEAVCTAEVICPNTRLVPVDTTNPEHVSRSNHAVNSSKRLDYELKFEYVPDSLRDLISKLLIKDPAHRITIAEAKKHPWVTEGITDPEGILRNPEITKESKKKIMEINDKEIDRAVVKRNFIEKISDTAGRVFGSLLGRKDNRKRASTAASSTGSSSDSLHSPAGSSASTIGKSDRTREARRTSLRGDELLQALKASREPPEHHPLSQSQTASPGSAGSPESSSNGYFDHGRKPASEGATPIMDMDRYSRPRGPDRAVSALSTADSVKTIRPTAQQRSLLADPTFNGEHFHGDSSIRSRVEGLWEGTTKHLTRLASKDRRHTSSRSRSNSRPTSEHDGHAGPSVSLSNTYATGAFQTPEVLKMEEAKPEEPVATSPITYMAEPRQSPFRAPSSDHLSFEQAQQINHRRQIQESISKSMNPATVTEPVPNTMTESCPPSPDDLTFANQSVPPSVQISPSGLDLGTITTAISASTIASSIDGYGESSVSQSISNPSIGIISGSSSPPGDTFLLDQHKIVVDSERPRVVEVESDIMKTADTVTIHGRPATPTATGKPLQAEQEYYGDGDDESDSDEDGIVMGRPQRR